MPLKTIKSIKFRVNDLSFLEDQFNLLMDFHVFTVIHIET